MSVARVDTTRKRKQLKFRQQAATSAALVVPAGDAGDMRLPGEGIKREATGSCFLVSPTVRTRKRTKCKVARRKPPSTKFARAWSERKKPTQTAWGKKLNVYASSIAPTGHCAAQAPQSTQRSAAISNLPSPSLMASQGQTLWQPPQAIHSLLIL